MIRNCIRLTKKLFKCNSQQRHQANYEFVGYGDNSKMEQSTVLDPLSSTAIHQKSPNQAFDTSNISHISALDSDASSQIEYSRGHMTSLRSSMTPQTIIHPSQKNHSAPHATPHDLSISYIQPIFLFNTTVETLNDCSVLQSTKITANISPINPLARTSLESKPSTASSSSSSSHHSSVVSSTFVELPLLLNMKSIQANLLHLMTNNSNIENVCISSYEAMFVEDLTVNVGDAVCILKDSNDDWLLVHLVEKSDQLGYVPRNIVGNIHSFLGRLHEQINKSKSSTISLPINV